MQINYAANTVSEEYHCHKCKVRECKLWREYQTFKPKLLCAACVLKNQKETGEFNEQGYREVNMGARTDAVGWYVPAIPDEEDLGFWGYTSVPPDGVNWWRALPTIPIPLFRSSHDRRD